MKLKKYKYIKVENLLEVRYDMTLKFYFGEIMKQSFTEKSLEKFYTAKDFYKLGIKSEDLNFTDILIKLEKEEISFPKFKVINSIFINTSISLEYTLLIRKLNDNIKRLYGVKQADRHSIIHQVQILLQETSRPISILRFDIQKFYESIDKNLILEKIIENDSLLSYQSKYILKNLLLENSQFKRQNGLPFGLNISATLSEIYMKAFDKNIKKIDGGHPSRPTRHFKKIRKEK